jgi:16S rRNA processing protein RimM
VDEPTIVVGRITKARGLKGELAVEVRSENPGRFEPGAHLFLEDGRELVVARSNEHGKRTFVTFEGVHDRTGAEALQGQLLVIPQTWLPELPEGEYWPFQLIGCEVVTEGGRVVGTLTEVLPMPANDIWVAVDDAGEETLIPAIRDVIIRVDPEAKRVEIYETER